MWNFKKKSLIPENMISYFILIGTIFILRTYSFDIESKILLENKVISSVIEQFYEHNIIYHYDNTSKHKIFEIGHRTKVNCSILMINYDSSRKQSTMISRPNGYKFLHIILLKNYRRINEFTKKSKQSVNNLDIIFVLVHLNSANKAKFKGVLYNLHKVGAFFILNVKSFSLYHVCFYCGKKIEKWQKLTDLTDNISDYYNNVKSLAQKIYKNQFRDFNGHIFKVGYTTYKPFYWHQ